MRIDESKLQMPDYSPIWKRDRLFKELDHCKHVSLFLITGDRGYGKTTLVSSYIRKKGIPAVWYQLGSTDRYAHIFLSYVKTGLLKEMGLTTTPQSVDAEKAEEELHYLLTLLSKREKPLLLVFDDYQLVDQSPEIQSIITQLIASSPLITVIIISRVRPQLPIAKWKVQRKFKELNTSDLTFTYDETLGFFNTMNQMALEDQEIQIIHERTEGWIASYQLILDLIGKMNQPERFLFWSTFPKVQDIYDYLSVEVLQAQPDEIKSFLYRTSFLPELDPDIINDFLGINNAGEILNHLLNQHLFVYRDHEGKIRYHRLFRQFLYQSYKEKLANDAFAKEHVTLARIYEHHHRLIHAFAHYTIGKDFFKAAEIMGKIRDRYNPVESMMFLDGWLEEISAGESFANNTLFLIRCVPLAALKELTALFEDNIAMLKKKKNEWWLCNLRHRLATIYLMRGDILKAKDLFFESLKGAEQFHDHAMSALNLVLLAEIHRYLGDYEQAAKLVRKSVFISDQHGNKHTQLQALDTLTTIYLDEKKVEKAAPHIQEALNIAQKHDRSSLMFVFTTMGKFYCVKGEYEKAVEWGEKAAQIAESFNYDFDIGWSNLELGKTYMKAREFEKAKQCFMKANRAFSLFTHYQCMVGICLYHLYRAMGDHTQAAKQQKEMSSVCEKHQFYWLKKALMTEPNIHIKERKPLFIQTLGRFQITYEGKPITIKRHSSLRLLQFLIANRSKKMEKDMIIDTVFPDGTLGSIENHFNVSLSVLRKTLEPGLSSGVRSRFIKRHGNQYVLDMKEIDLDIDRFEELVRDERNIENLKKAEALYKGDFCEEFPYESFLEQDREQFRKLYIQTARTIARHEYKSGDAQNCFMLFEKIIKIDPFDEEVLLEYLELLLRENRVSKANSAAQKMKILYENEMGICIDGQISDLFLKYRAQQSYI